MKEYTKKEHYEAKIHYMMAFIGGFLGSYTVYGLAKGFGNGLTGNVVSIITNFFKGNWVVVVTRIIAFFIYGRSIVLVTWLPVHRPQVNRKKLSLLITAAAGIILAFLPRDLPAVIGLYPTFFAMGFQWCCFPGAYGFNCSSIFNTNNFRQLFIGLTQVYLNKDESHRMRIRFYGRTLLAFHFGVVMMCVLWIICGIGEKTSLLVLPACAAAYYLLQHQPVE